MVLRGTVFLGASLSRSRPPCLDDPSKYGVEGCFYRTFWAVVETGGTFVRGRNVARVVNRSPRTCSFVPLQCDKNGCPDD